MGGSQQGRRPGCVSRRDCSSESKALSLLTSYKLIAKFKLYLYHKVPSSLLNSTISSTGSWPFPCRSYPTSHSALSLPSSFCGHIIHFLSSSGMAIPRTRWQFRWVTVIYLNTNIFMWIEIKLKWAWRTHLRGERNHIQVSLLPQSLEVKEQG